MKAQHWNAQPFYNIFMQYYTAYTTPDSWDIIIVGEHLILYSMFMVYGPCTVLEA